MVWNGRKGMIGNSSVKRWNEKYWYWGMRVKGSTWGIRSITGDVCMFSSHSTVFLQSTYTPYPLCKWFIAIFWSLNFLQLIWFILQKRRQLKRKKIKIILSNSQEFLLCESCNLFFALVLGVCKATYITHYSVLLPWCCERQLYGGGVGLGINSLLFYYYWWDVSRNAWTDNRKCSCHGHPLSMRGQGIRAIDR